MKQAIYYSRSCKRHSTALTIARSGRAQARRGAIRRNCRERSGAPRTSGQARSVARGWHVLWQRCPRRCWDVSESILCRRDIKCWGQLRSRNVKSALGGWASCRALPALPQVVPVPLALHDLAARVWTGPCPPPFSRRAYGTGERLGRN